MSRIAGQPGLGFMAEWSPEDYYDLNTYLDWLGVGGDWWYGDGGGGSGDYGSQYDFWVNGGYLTPDEFDQAYFGGDQLSDTLGQPDVFDPQTGTWRITTDIPGSQTHWWENVSQPASNRGGNDSGWSWLDDLANFFRGVPVDDTPTGIDSGSYGPCDPATHQWEGILDPATGKPVIRCVPRPAPLTGRAAQQARQNQQQQQRQAAQQAQRLAQQQQQKCPPASAQAPYGYRAVNQNGRLVCVPLTKAEADKAKDNSLWIWIVGFGLLGLVALNRSGRSGR